MDIDTDRIDEAVLALLYLGRHKHNRAWKSFDWNMAVLHRNDSMSDSRQRGEIRGIHRGGAETGGSHVREDVCKSRLDTK